jgi:hypothetical protein
LHKKSNLVRNDENGTLWKHVVGVSHCLSFAEKYVKVVQSHIKPVVPNYSFTTNTKNLNVIEVARFKKVISSFSLISFATPSSSQPEKIRAIHNFKPVI